MTPDTPPASVANLVHEGERLRMALLDEMRRAPSTAHKAAVATELVMLYGQAFRRVYDACISQPSHSILEVKAMHECVCGLAIHRVWLISETPVNPTEDYERLTAHWRKVTAMVLGTAD